MPLSQPAMKMVLIASCAVALTALQACHPARLGQGQNRDDRAVAVNARLDCPQSQGALKRIDVAADGRSCRYADEAGREARVALLDLAGRPPKEALAGVETDLKALIPAAAPPPDAPQPPTPPNGAHDRTRIDLPGIHIETDGDDGAHIRAFGQTVEARGKSAVVRGGWNGKQAVVTAHEGGVEVRGGWFGAQSVNASYLLASDEAGPGGLHAAGYYARGPVSGPLVVGTQMSKSQDDHEQSRNDIKDLRRLVDLNVHRGRDG